MKENFENTLIFLCKKKKEIQMQLINFFNKYEVC